MIQEPNRWGSDEELAGAIILSVLASTLTATAVFAFTLIEHSFRVSFLAGLGTFCLMLLACMLTYITNAD